MKYIYYLIIIFIILIICYFIYPSHISIHQTNLSQFTFDNLYLRQPIIIEDQIVDVHNVISIWFYYNFVNLHIPFIKSQWYRTNYKYTIIKTSKDTEIILSNPYTKIINNEPHIDSNIISIKLKKNQLIIVPFKWYILSDIQNNSQIIGIHDIITYFNIF